MKILLRRRGSRHQFVKNIAVIELPIGGKKIMGVLWIKERVILDSYLSRKMRIGA